MTDVSTAAKVVRVIGQGAIVFAWFALAAIGLRMLITGSPVVGLALVALGSATLGLAIQRFRAGQCNAAGELPSAEYDYIIWTALAVPLLLAGLLLVLLLTGGLDPQ